MKIQPGNYRILIAVLAGLLSLCPANAETEKILFETGFEDSEDVSQLGIRDIQRALEGNTGEASLRFTQRRVHLPVNPIPINPELAYRLEGSFKAAPGSEGTAVFMALKYSDEQGEQISNFGIIPVPGTETVLKSYATAGELEVLLENSGQNWPDEGVFAVAFEAKSDLSDIPNHNVFKISSVSIEEDGLRVSLEEPLTKDFPADTPMRWHQLADPVIAGTTPSGNWDEHSLTVRGSASPGDSRQVLRTSIWPGAAAVQITLGFKERESVEQGREIWVDDIRLIEITE